MIFSGLADVLQHSGADTVVAFNEQQQYSRENFLAAVRALSEKLQAHAAPRWLLVHNNTYFFAVGLLSLLAAGKQVVLPPNARSGTLAALGNL